MSLLSLKIDLRISNARLQDFLTDLNFKFELTQENMQMYLRRTTDKYLEKTFYDAELTSSLLLTIGEKNDVMRGLFLILCNEKYSFVDFFEIPDVSKFDIDQIQTKIHDASTKAAAIIKEHGNKVIKYVVHNNARDFGDHDEILFIKSIKNIIRDKLRDGLKIINFRFDAIDKVNQFLNLLKPFDNESFNKTSYLESVAEIMEGYGKISDIMENEDITNFFHERILAGIFFNPLLRINFYEKASRNNKDKIDDAHTVELIALELTPEDRRCYKNYTNKIAAFKNWWDEQKLDQSSYKQWALVRDADVLKEFALGLCEIPATVPEFKFDSLYEIDVKEGGENIFGNNENYWLYVSLQFENVMSGK